MNRAAIRPAGIPVNLENGFTEARQRYWEASVSEPEREELREKLLDMAPYLDREDLLALLVSDFGEACVYARLGQVHKDEIRRLGYSGLGELAAHYSELEAISDLNKGRNPARRGDGQVTLFSGQFVHKEVDLRLKGRGLHFEWTRTYKNQVVYSGPLGANWDHNYNLWLRIEDGGIRVSRTTGRLREDCYVLDEATGSYRIPDGTFGKLSHETCLIGTTSLGERYVLKTPDGTRYIYRALGSDAILHKVEYITDRFGNTLQFHYDSDRRLETILDTLKKEIVLRYDEYDRIVEVADGARVVHYAYDDANDLVKVCLPKPTADQCPPTRSYEYVSPSLPFPLIHNLVSVTDAEGNRCIENEYGIASGRESFNKVVTQRLGNGELRYEYLEPVAPADGSPAALHQPARRTILTTPSGQTVEYEFNASGNLLCKEECIATAGELAVPVRTEYRYNRDGNVIWQRDPSGGVSQFMYGREAHLGERPLPDEKRTFGNLLRSIRRCSASSTVSLDEFELIDPEDIVVNRSYDNAYNLITAESDPRNGDWKTEYTYTDDPSDPDSASFEGRYLASICFPAATLPNGMVQRRSLKFRHNEHGQIKEIVTARPTRAGDADVSVETDPPLATTKYYYFGEAVEDEPGVADDEEKSGRLYTVVADHGEDTPDRVYLNVKRRFDVDRAGNVIALTDGLGQRTVRHFDALDRLVETILPLNGIVERREYTGDNRLARVTFDNKDPDGNPDPADPFCIAEYCYDETGNPVKIGQGIASSAGEIVTQKNYTPCGRLCRVIKPKGNMIRHRYDERGLVRSVIRGFGSPQASTTAYDYDASRRLTRIVDGEGNEKRMTYDEFGRVTRLTDAEDNQIRYAYDKTGNVISRETIDGGGNRLNRIEYDFDEMRRLRERTDFRFEASDDPGTAVRTRFYHDEENNLIRVVNDKEQKTDYEYDALNRLTRNTDNAGNIVRTEYDHNGNITRVTTFEKELDESGSELGQEVFVLVNEYDPLGRLTKTVDNLGNTSRRWYDSRGNLVRAEDPLANVTRFDYDVFGRQTTERALWSEAGREVVTRYSYDDNGLLSRARDDAGNLTTFDYDSLDRQTQVTYADGSLMTTAYDRCDNPVRVTDPNSLVRTYRYDRLNRLKRLDIDHSEVVLPGDHAVLGASFEAYDYDGLGRILSAENDNGTIEYAYDSLGMLLRETFAGLEVVSEYDTGGFRTELVYPGGRTLRMTPDGLNRICTIETADFGPAGSFPGDPGEAGIVTNRYIGAARLKSRSFANGAEVEWDYDGGGRAIAVRHGKSGTVLTEIQNLHDAGGNRRVEATRQIPEDACRAFFYDSLQRLTVADDGVAVPPIDVTRLKASSSDVGIEPGDPPTQIQIDALIETVSGSDAGRFQYEMDGLGNRRTRQRTGAADIDYDSNELNQYRRVDGQTYVYDSNGNLIDDGTRTYFYDYRNRLVQVREGTERIVAYKYDAIGRRIERDAAGLVTHFIHDGMHVIEERDARNDVLAQYVYGGGIDATLQMARNGRNYYYHRNSLGSTIALTSGGEGFADVFAYTPFGTLTTSENASQTPYLFGGRRFFEETGLYHHRARDYSPELGRFLQRDPKGYEGGMNLYSYAGNNPVNFIDPFGTDETYVVAPEFVESAREFERIVLEQLDIPSRGTNLQDAVRRSNLREVHTLMTLGGAQSGNMDELNVYVTRGRGEVVSRVQFEWTGGTVVDYETDDPVIGGGPVAGPADIAAAMPERPSDWIGDVAGAMSLASTPLRVVGGILSLAPEEIVLIEGYTVAANVFSAAEEAALVARGVAVSQVPARVGWMALTAESLGSLMVGVAMPFATVAFIVGGLNQLGSVHVEAERVGISNGYTDALRAYARADFGASPSMPGDRTAEYHQGWRTASRYLERMRADAPDRYMATMRTVQQMSRRQIFNSAYGQGMYRQTE